MRNYTAIANNQRILHDFLFEKDTEFSSSDIAKRAKTYFSHRTKTSFNYTSQGEEISPKKVQLEIDLTIEFNGIIGVFEAKNKIHNNFAVYQLYHPFLYYYNADKAHPDIKGKIKEIYGVFVVREEQKNQDILSLWCYTFECPLEITSIKLTKSSAYRLVSDENI